MNVRQKAQAARIARERMRDGIPSDDDICTGTVQTDANGGAWVHCMVFVPPIAFEEDNARKKERSNG